MHFFVLILLRQVSLYSVNPMQFIHLGREGVFKSEMQKSKGKLKLSVVLLQLIIFLAGGEFKVLT
jgi:hypothetical protein